MRSNSQFYLFRRKNFSKDLYIIRLRNGNRLFLNNDLCCNFFVYPINEICNFSIDSWMFGLGASYSPTDYSNQYLCFSINHWTTTISLTRVYATLFYISSTNH